MMKRIDKKIEREEEKKMILCDYIFVSVLFGLKLC